MFGWKLLLITVYCCDTITYLTFPVFYPKCFYTWCLLMPSSTHPASIHTHILKMKKDKDTCAVHCFVPADTALVGPLERFHIVLAQGFVQRGWQTSHFPTQESPRPARHTKKHIVKESKISNKCTTWCLYTKKTASLSRHRRLWTNLKDGTIDSKEHLARFLTHWRHMTREATQVQQIAQAAAGKDKQPRHPTSAWAHICCH